MNIRRKTAATVVAAALACGAFAFGLAGSSGAVAPAVYLRTTTAKTDLNAGPAQKLVTSVSVPAGTWIVTANATAVSFQNADYIRCRITVGGVQRDAKATLLGNAAPGPTGELGPSAAVMSLQVAVKTLATKTFALTCGHDFLLAGPPYLDPGASLMVVKAPGPIG
jgi:hypothetical protein